MILSKKSHLKTAALTHPGMTGKNNEDRYAVQSFKSVDGSADDVLFALVADGVGGKQAGEIAAEIAVETILRMVTESDGTEPLATLRAAYLESNRRILERADENFETSGMATTATCAWIFGDRLYIANIGNSRMYLLRDKQLRRISIDHSWVEEALSLGLITEEQARDHPNARIITRHLGSKNAEPDLRLQLAPDEEDDQMEANQGMQLLTGDILMICSDGLSDVVWNPEIEAALNEYPLEEALKNLTDLANERGGPDNITSVAIQVPEKPVPAPKTEPTQKKKPKSRLGNYLLSSIVLVILIIAGWLTFLMFFQSP